MTIPEPTPVCWNARSPKKPPTCVDVVVIITTVGMACAAIASTDPADPGFALRLASARAAPGEPVGGGASAVDPAAGLESTRAEPAGAPPAVDPGAVPRKMT
jgi:hypothetical protein